MENLHLPDINLAFPPEYNMKTYSYYDLKPDINKFKYTLDNFFSFEECKHVIKLGRSFIMSESRTGNLQHGGTNGISEIRRSYNSWIPPCNISYWLFEKISKGILHVNQIFNFDLHSLENLQFTRYDDHIHGGYDIHTDSFESSISSNSHRKLSFSVQLSLPDNYEGGKLLLYPSGKDPIECENSQGTIHFFPSNVIHTVTPVTKGIRYSLVGWINGPKFR